MIKAQGDKEHAVLHFHGERKMEDKPNESIQKETQLTASDRLPV